MEKLREGYEAIKKRKYISIILVALLICGCSKTDDKETQQLETNEKFATQQLDVSQIEDIQLPDQIAELADSQLEQSDLDTMVSYDTSQWEYQILDRIQAFGYTASDFAHPVEDCESLYQN